MNTIQDETNTDKDLEKLKKEINHKLIDGCYSFLPKEWLTETPPEHKFCVNPLVPIGAVTLLNAHGGTGKSIFALKMAIHIALGIPIIGAETNGDNVAYMSLEDPKNVVQNRIFNIFKKLPEDYQRIDDLTRKMMIIDRYGLPTHMVKNESNNNIITDPIADAFSVLLKENAIKCLFVDTFIRTNPLNENDNAHMSRLLIVYEKIAREAECGVVLIHHLPKGNANRLYAARGASAITDNARSAMLLQRVMKSKNDVNKFAEGNIKTALLEERLIEVTHIKHNYSIKYPERYLEMTTDGILLEIDSISLPTLHSNESNIIQKQRYKELYDWWTDTWKCKPLAKEHIDKNSKYIRPSNTRYGKETYKVALDWAIKNKYAEISEGKSKNKNAKYYILKKFDEI